MMPSGPPRLRGLWRRSQCSQHWWHQGQGSTHCALVPLHLPRVRPRPWEPDPAREAAPPVPKVVKECGSDPSRATYHPLSVPIGSREVVE